MKLRRDADNRAIGPRDLRLFIFTIDRTKQAGIHGGQNVRAGCNYIHQTLSSLWMSDPLVHRLTGVELMLGNEYKDYLWWFYRHTSRINIREAPAGLTTECETPHEKLTRNYIRTLKAAYAMGDEGVIICEDDVVFVDGFLDYALDAINEMRCSELPREHNVLSFYSVSHFIGDVSLYRGRYFCSYPGMQCAGLCGIYYDRGVLESLIQYLEGHFGEQPADLMFGDWSRIEYVRYATPTGLVQHVGGVSAGTSPGHYWTDGRFNAEMKCWEPGWVPVAYSRFPFRKD